MKCKLFLTFDHELPLGGLRTSAREALFDPTDKVLDIAEQTGVRVTLFTDILCAYRFNEWNKNNFFYPYEDQLHKALCNDHDVQLHLHPHWLTTAFDGHTFLPSKDFSLADFMGHQEWNIGKIIKHGVNFLTELCSVPLSDYQCLAFRAGGYHLDPGSAEIFKNLTAQGIRYDSSVCKNYRFSSGLSTIDFGGMPKKPNWFIDAGGNYKQDAGTGILEIPIAGIPKTIFEIPTRFKLKKYASRAPINHGNQIHAGRPATLKNKITQLSASRMLSFDNYTFSADYLMRILAHSLRKYRMYDEVLLCAIGHPKTMGEYSMGMLKEFILKVQKKYPRQVEFYTYRQLFGEQKNQRP